MAVCVSASERMSEESEREERNESACVKVPACQESVAASFRGESCHHHRCLDSIDYAVVRD